MWSYHILQDQGDRLDDLFNNLNHSTPPPQQIGYQKMEYCLLLAVRNPLGRILWHRRMQNNLGKSDPKYWDITQLETLEGWPQDKEGKLIINLI